MSSVHRGRRPLRILLVTHSYWPEQTPPQRRWQNFISHLQKRGCEVFVITQGIVGSPSEEVGPGGERIHRTRLTSISQSTRWSRLLNSTVHSAKLMPLARKYQDVDMVITTVPALPNLVAGYAIAHTIKKPFVVEMRDAWPDLLTEANVGGKLISRSASSVISTIQKTADLVITVTEGFAESLRNRGLENVVAIPNGVARAQSALLPHNKRQPGTLNVLYLGNHGESQNLGLLLEAAALARAKNPQIQVRLVGDGTQKSHLEALNVRLGGPVHMHDAVPLAKAPVHYRWADTCVVSLRADWSSFVHTVPSKLYEILATGKHITGLLRGEAAESMQRAGQEPLGTVTAQELAQYWLSLAEDPGATPRYEISHRWALNNVSLDAIASQLFEVLISMKQDEVPRLKASRPKSSRLRNVRLAMRTAQDHIGQDPAVFSLQVARRLPPALSEPLTSAASKVRGGALDLVGAVGMATRGQTQGLREALHQAVESRDSSRKILQLVELLTSLGEIECARWGIGHVPPDARGYRSAAARIEWHQGNMRTAVNLLDVTGTEGKQRAGYLSQLRVFEGAKAQLTPVAEYEPEDKKILHVLTNSLPHTGSGYAQRSHSILLALKENGWDVSAVTRLGWPVITGALNAKREDNIDGISYCRLIPERLEKDYERREQQYAQLLLEHALQTRPALLHTTSHWTNANAVRAVAQALGIPWVYEVRGLLADTWASTRSESAYESDYYQLFVQREADSVQAADAVVTLGAQMRKKLEALGAEESRIVLSPNAIGGPFLDEPRTTAEARNILGLPLKAELVGTVSSLVPYEGLDTVVRAVARLAPRRPLLRLALVGDGTARQELLRLAEDLGIADRVIAPGRVGRNLSSFYHQALDVFVVPRVDSPVTRTVTPMKSVEASASAKPVIASNLPALAELVIHGETGLLAPASDEVAWSEAIEALLDDAEMRTRMGKSGRSWALAERTWSANEIKYSRLYKDLLA